MDTKTEISEELLISIKNLPKPTLVGISGFGGSGKSSVAHKLSEAWDAPVVGVDSFQKKGAFDTAFSLWEIMDYARLEREVLEPFFRGADIRYGHFDASKGAISRMIEMKNTGMLIIEGVGLFRPELMKYFSYKIWVDVPIEVAIARGKKRDREEYGNPTDKLWDGVWKENDLEYYRKLRPDESADMIIKNP
jgi:uridine kinase